jgi:hypothetical protein
MREQSEGEIEEREREERGREENPAGFFAPLFSAFGSGAVFFLLSVKKTEGNNN